MGEEDVWVEARAESVAGTEGAESVRVRGVEGMELVLLDSSGVCPEVGESID